MVWLDTSCYGSGYTTKMRDAPQLLHEKKLGHTIGFYLYRSNNFRQSVRKIKYENTDWLSSSVLDEN